MDSLNNIINPANPNIIPQQNQIVDRIKEISKKEVIAGVFALRAIKQEVQVVLQDRALSPTDRDAILQATRICHKNFGHCEKDLTLVVEGKELQVNSVLLACLSPQFAALVATSQYAEDPSPEPIPLSDISYAQMRQICTFLHGDSLPFPITLAEVEELLQLAELANRLGLPSVVKACDAAFCDIPKGWSIFRTLKAKFKGTLLATQLPRREDLLLRIIKIPGLKNVQQALGDLAASKISIPCSFDASNRTLLDNMLAENSQSLDTDLSVRRWGKKTDAQKRLELTNCQELANYLVENRADLDDSGHWMLEASFQNDLKLRSLDLFRFFLFIASSTNSNHHSFLPPILRALQRSYFSGNLSNEDAEWVLRIAGRDQALLQVFDEERVFFALKNSPDEFFTSVDKDMIDLPADSEAMCPIVTGSRFVCAVRSDMLNTLLVERILTPGLGLSLDNPIDLKGITTDLMQMTLNWMRTETVDIESLTIEQIKQLLEILGYFGCKNYEQRFDDYLIREADKLENVLTCLRIAQKRNMPQLLEASLDTLAKAGIIRINTLPDGRLKITELDHSKAAEYPQLQEVLHLLTDRKEATLKYWAEQPPMPPRTWRKVLFDQLSRDRTWYVIQHAGTAISTISGAVATHFYQDRLRDMVYSAASMAYAPIPWAFSYVPYGSAAYEQLASTIGSIDMSSIFSSAQAAASYVPYGSHVIATAEVIGGFTIETLNTSNSLLRTAADPALSLYLIGVLTYACGNSAYLGLKKFQEDTIPNVLNRLVPPPRPFIVNPHELAQIVAPANNASLGLLPGTLSPQLQTLRLDATACHALTNEEIRRLVTSYPQLTELTLEGECPLVDGPGWKYLAKLEKLKRLAVTLKFSEHHTVAPFESLNLNELYPSWPEFETVDLYLEGSGGSQRRLAPSTRELTFLTNCPVFRQVRLNLLNDFSAFSIDAITRACPAMTSLRRTDNRADLLRFFPHDKCLHLKHLSASVLYDDDLIMLARVCRKLTHLRLRDCLSVTHEGIERLVYYCKELEEVSIECEELNNLSIDALATLPKLRSIELIGTRITDHGIEPLLNRGNLPPLEWISVTKSPFISVAMQRRLIAHLLHMQSSHIEADKQKISRWLELLTPWSDKDKTLMRKAQFDVRMASFLGLDTLVQNHWLLFRAPLDEATLRKFGAWIAPLEEFGIRMPLLEELEPWMPFRQQLATAFEIPEEGTIRMSSGSVACKILANEYGKRANFPVAPGLQAQFLEELFDVWTEDSFAKLICRGVGLLAHYAPLVDHRQILPIIESYLQLSESAVSMNDLAEVTRKCKEHIHLWLSEHKQLVFDAILVQWTRYNKRAFQGDIDPAAPVQQLLPHLFSGFEPADKESFWQTIAWCQAIVVDACRAKNLSPEDRMRLLLGTIVLTLAETIPDMFVEAVNQLKNNP